MTEISSAGAQRQNEVIVIKLLPGQSNAPFLQIDIDHIFHQHGEIRFVRENGANRLRDVGRGQTGRSDLIEQWLKKVMIRPINHRDAHGWTLEILAKS